ncbi:superoxide dismutase, putative [Pediculus humanus corporis]|uniref:Superoxide dismutase [Cu-Zn] n=1 Tax=Pediculus humanus subsp. corporis TaxID=121224 RepID=E0VY69_PEDHC|nr:superoxide dismutase, putative [Pediculus humanus corporis]EEB18325.1 superoxide dismutase, putative [Pediculus humanus corporis]
MKFSIDFYVKKRKRKTICKNALTGDVIFRQTNPEDPVEITGVISGLSPGFHGFHVHQNPDLSDNCKGAGPHFNPEQLTHGAPHETIRHAGDLGNIPVDPSGFSTFQLTDRKITLCSDSNLQILGKSIVVHEKEDDLGKGGNEESKKTGNAGARVACCVIEAASQYLAAP